MTPAEIRIQYLRRLNQIAQRLPNGLLARLVDDAAFYSEWQQGKRAMRGRGRMAQEAARVQRAEDKYWKEVRSKLA